MKQFAPCMLILWHWQWSGRGLERTRKQPAGNEWELRRPARTFRRWMIWTGRGPRPGFILRWLWQKYSITSCCSWLTLFALLGYTVCCPITRAWKVLFISALSALQLYGALGLWVPMLTLTTLQQSSTFPKPIFSSSKFICHNILTSQSHWHVVTK